MSLTLTTGQPGFTELPDATFNTGNPVSSSAMKSLNADAKFAAVRNEQFWGYYRNGETVQLPTSPADGYNYSRSELVYTWSLYSSSPPPGALNGTQSAPTPAANSGPGQILIVGPNNVNQSTGVVSTGTSYYNGSTQTNTGDGILMVMTQAQRNR